MSSDNLDDYPGENPYDNTFSPRAFMRGADIYTGFAYTPNGDRTEKGNEASNFWIHRFNDTANHADISDIDPALIVDGLAWLGPQQVSFEQGGTSALDPRFVPTPAYNKTGVDAGLESDKSNPDVLLMSYGTADADHELDVLYSRSTDQGETFEYHIIDAGDDGVEGTADDQVRFHFLSKWALPVEEKEVQLIGSPDGNMGFNVWLQESDVPPDGVDNNLGLESYLGRVDWNCTEVDVDGNCIAHTYDEPVE
jgi:hypothetical protein